MQASFSEWDELIGDLYDAVTAPHLLGTAIRKFESLIQSDGVHLFALNGSAAEQLTVSTIDWLDDDALAPYYAHYVHEDPRKAAADARPLMQVYKCSDYFSNGFVDRNGFYQDYLLPLGARYVAGATLARNADHFAYLTFNRAKGRPDFGSDELALIQRYVPHVSRAVHLAMDRQMLNLRQAAGLDVLDSQDIGLIGLSQRNTVLYRNKVAASFMDAIAGALFLAGRVRADAHLISVIANAHQTRRPQAFRFLEKGVEYVLSVCPASKDMKSTWLPAVERCIAGLHTVITVRKVLPGEKLTHSALIQLFQLTPAEARLARELARGLSVDDYAQAFSLSVATVRTQLRSVLSKTGYARQLDLVRMLAALPNF